VAIDFQTLTSCAFSLTIVQNQESKQLRCPAILVHNDIPKLEAKKNNMIIKNIVAVVVGIVLGSLANIALVNLGPMVIPIPEGADVSTLEKLRESMHLFSPANFLFPFLSHAVGTLVGAFVTTKLAASRHLTLAIGVGCYFLLGGIAAVILLGGPLWFQAVDLIVAYLPMAYLGAFLAGATPAKPS